jgi:hypothetical protein
MAELYWIWQPPATGPAPTSYNLYRGPAGAETLYQSGITDTHFLDTNATPGVAYSGYVTAITGGTESAASNEAGPITPVAPPPAPTSLTATAQTTSVALGWAATAGATGYDIGRSITPGGPYTIIQFNAQGATYVDQTAAIGVLYYYVIYGYNAAGEGAASNEASARRLPAVATNEQHLFSTGTLFAQVSGKQLASSLITPTRGQFGTAATVTQPLANLIDGNSATLLDLNSSSGSNYQYAILDLGVSRVVSKVVVKNLICTSALNVVVQAAAPSGAKPTPGTGNVVLTATPTPTFPAANADLIFLSGATSPTGRYVVIFTTGVESFSLGDVSVYTTPNFIPAPGIELAQLQNISLETKYQEKKLFGPNWVSEFAVDVAFYGAEAVLKAESAAFSADAITQLVAAVQSGTTTLTETISKIVTLPPMSAVFQGQDNAGKSVTFKYNLVYVPGAQIPMKAEDFAMTNFEMHAFPDSDGVLGTIVLGA